MKIWIYFTQDTGVEAHTMVIYGLRRGEIMIILNDLIGMKCRGEWLKLLSSVK